MATVFLDLQNIIKIDCFEKGKTVRELYYGELLRQLQKKRPHCLRKNTFPPRSATSKLLELFYDLLFHFPYSLNLVRCDFFLFAKVKNHSAPRNLGGVSGLSPPRSPSVQTSRRRIFQTV